MKQIQDARSPKNIYKTTRWHKKCASFVSPPINFEGISCSGPNSKELALHKALLERISTSEDTEINAESLTYRAKLHMWESKEMVGGEHCLLKSSNTAPRIYGFTTQVIRACWNSTKNAILRL